MRRAWNNLVHLVMDRLPARVALPGALLLVWLLPTVYVLAGMAVWFTLERVRARRPLCGLCMAEAMHDPQEAVARRRRLLRIGHILPNRVVLLLVVAGFLPASLVVLALGDVLGLAGPALAPAMALTILPVAVVVDALALHSRFRLWCPWCRRRGGGWGGVESPDPDPHLAATR